MKSFLISIRWPILLIFSVFIFPDITYAHGTGGLIGALLIVSLFIFSFSFLINIIFKDAIINDFLFRKPTILKINIFLLSLVEMFIVFGELAFWIYIYNKFTLPRGIVFVSMAFIHSLLMFVFNWQIVKLYYKSKNLMKDTFKKILNALTLGVATFALVVLIFCFNIYLMIN